MIAFTEMSNAILAKAYVEATSTRLHFIGTEHILLALIKEDKCIASNILKQLGLTERSIKEAIQKVHPSLVASE